MNNFEVELTQRSKEGLSNF